eukprot:TRINITY_DN51075_c0_g1_i1.p1 TRINITY_DN51075_c0_g1~~TRINITY_DN51075_c0_g1_i1.p1  ORF type:complete len:417 (-),score=52.71 TRINITY_DN51075_c0_g1_i1:126-1376(-)
MVASTLTEAIVAEIHEEMMVTLLEELQYCASKCSMLVAERLERVRVAAMQTVFEEASLRKHTWHDDVHGTHKAQDVANVCASDDVSPEVNLAGCRAASVSTCVPSPIPADIPVRFEAMDKDDSCRSDGSEVAHEPACANGVASRMDDDTHSNASSDELLECRPTSPSRKRASSDAPTTPLPIARRASMQGRRGRGRRSGSLISPLKRRSSRVLSRVSQVPFSSARVLDMSSERGELHIHLACSLRGCDFLDEAFVDKDAERREENRPEKDALAAWYLERPPVSQSFENLGRERFEEQDACPFRAVPCQPLISRKVDEHDEGIATQEDVRRSLAGHWIGPNGIVWKLSEIENKGDGRRFVCSKGLVTIVHTGEDFYRADFGFYSVAAELKPVLQDTAGSTRYRLRFWNGQTWFREDA